MFVSVSLRVPRSAGTRQPAQAQGHESCFTEDVTSLYISFLSHEFRFCHSPVQWKVRGGNPAQSQPKQVC